MYFVNQHKQKNSQKIQIILGGKLNTNTKTNNSKFFYFEFKQNLQKTKKTNEKDQHVFKQSNKTNLNLNKKKIFI